MSDLKSILDPITKFVATITDNPFVYAPLEPISIGVEYSIS